MLRPSASLGLLLLASVVSSQRSASAPAAPPLRAVLPGGAAPSSAGDSPLAPLATFRGNVDAFVAVKPFVARYGTSGTFRIGSIPMGARILGAWLLVTSFPQGTGEISSLTFAGNAVGARPADVVDAVDIPHGGGIFYCSLYRFDVASWIEGNGTYAYAAVSQSNCYGDALVVVYEHASLPLRTIVVHDGSEAIADAVSTTVFEDLPATTGDVLIFTQADNRSSAERILWNGVDLRPPRDFFRANAGEYASLVRLELGSRVGSNSLGVATTGFFGLHLALLRLDGV